MPVEGYLEYERREYCKDIKCPLQLRLDAAKEGSREYEETRDSCKNACLHTTYQFHHWLMNQGYEIVRLKNGGT
jgi:hypothetical protein